MSGPRRRGGLVLVLSLLLGSVVALSTPAVAAPKKQRPDLVVAKVLVKPGKVSAGGTLRVTETTRNKGRRTAKRSVTRYYLSKNKKVDKKDVRLGQRKLKRLKRGSRAVVKNRKLRVPAGTKPGKYRLLACADAKKQVRESRERNNCRVAGRRVSVTAAKGPAMPHNGSVKVKVRLTADHHRWSHSDTPGSAFEHQEDTTIRYTGVGTGWLMVRNGKPDFVTWQWSAGTASGKVTYTAQGEGTGIDECPLWSAQGTVTSGGSALDTAHAGGIVATASSGHGLAADMALEHLDLGSIEVDKMACGQVYSRDRTLRLALKPYWWGRAPQITLKWSPDLLTVNYHKRGTVNDPSYSEQGWDERGTVELTPIN